MKKVTKRMQEWRAKTEVKRSIDKYKGIEGIDYVECKVCGKRGLYIDARHLDTRHSLTKKQYLKLYPDALMVSEKKSKAQSRPNNIGNKGKKFSNDHKDRIAITKLGNKNPAWKGGISCEPYCRIWTRKQFKKTIKQRDNYTCQNPYCWGKSSVLDIHHINYNKQDCSPKNLITLCHSCNSRANTKRGEWQKLYSDIIKKE